MGGVAGVVAGQNQPFQTPSATINDQVTRETQKTLDGYLSALERTSDHPMQGTSPVLNPPVTGRTQGSSGSSLHGQTGTSQMSVGGWTSEI